MMLFAKMTDVSTFCTIWGTLSIVPTAQRGGYESAAKSPGERGQPKERGRSRVYEHRSGTQTEGRKAPRRQHKVQAEDDGAVLLCRD